MFRAACAPAAPAVSNAGTLSAAAAPRPLTCGLRPAPSVDSTRSTNRSRIGALFRDVDIIIAPATPCSAPLIGQETVEIDGAILPARAYLGVYTQPLSFIGLPIVAAPLRQPGEMPIGVQIIAAPWREADALRVAWTLERNGITNAEPANA